MKLPSNYCLATVTSENFCTGTEVMLYSFLRFNPWFKGDIVVMTDNLPERCQQRLQKLYPIRFEHRSNTVESKVNNLRKQLPELRSDLHLRVLSLETFRFEEYDRIVFIDSDAICSGCLLQLFELDDDFAAVRDGFGYEDICDPLLQKAGEQPLSISRRYAQNALTDSFNSGVMSISKRYLSAQTYEQLTQYFDDLSIWRDFGIKGFTDQMVLNIHFQGNVALLDGRYNFMPFIEAYIQRSEALTLLDAKVIHFAGYLKPWYRYDFAQVLEFAPQYLKYLQIWQGLWDQMHHGHNLGYMAQQIRSQYDWIESGNDQKVQRLEEIKH